MLTNPFAYFLLIKILVRRFFISYYKYQREEGETLWKHSFTMVFGHNFIMISQKSKANMKSVILFDKKNDLMKIKQSLTHIISWFSLPE